MTVRRLTLNPRTSPHPCTFICMHVETARVHVHYHTADTGPGARRFALDFFSQNRNLLDAMVLTCMFLMNLKYTNKILLFTVSRLKRQVMPKKERLPVICVTKVFCFSKSNFGDIV